MGNFKGKEWKEKLKTDVDFAFSNKKNHTLHAYIDIAGGLVEGTLLTQILYWCGNNKDESKDKLKVFRNGEYWLAKGRESWWEEIRITPRQFDTAVKNLKKKNLIDTARFHFGGVPTIHVRPIYKEINRAIDEWKENYKKVIEEENGKEKYVHVNSNLQNCKITDCKNSNSQESEMEISDLQNANNIYNNINNTDTENTNRDYITETTKEKGENINKVNAEVKTSVSEKKQMHTQKSAKQRYLDKKADEFEMLNSILLICSSNYEEKIGNEIFKSLEHYFEKYTQKTGLIHPILKYETLEDIIDKMANYSDTEYYHFENIASQEGAFIKIIDAFFDGDFGSVTGQRTNWHLPHFVSDGVLDRLTQRLWEKGEVY